MKRTASFAFVLLGIAALVSAPAQTAPRLIVKNGRLQGPGAPARADTIVIDDGVIRAVGHGFSLSDRDGDVVVDARGGVVLPGFHDSHVHMLGGGLSLVRVELSSERTLDGVLARVKAYADAHPESSWILGRGWQYGILPTGELPTAAMLDRVVKDRPVFLRAYDGHTGWANSLALQLAGVTKATRDPDDGTIVRDEKGNPTGALKEGAQALLDAVLPKPSRAEKKAALKAAAEHCAALGITAVDDIVYELDAFEIYEELEREGALPLRVKISPPLDPTELGATLETYVQWRERLRDSALLSFGFLKGFVDGVVESKTAFLLSPYHGMKDGDEGARGRPLLPKEKLFPLVDAATARGFQVALHAIGDAAVRLSLDAFEAAQKAHPDIGVRHRVEHIEVLDPADASRFAALDVIASMQPFHANPFGDEPEKGPWAENLGPARWDMTMPWRSLRSAGAPLTFGSDWPVYTADPLDGLAVALTRRDENGKPTKGWTAHQVLTLDEALHAYAVERGDADGPAEHVGRLAPGQRGDLVVLDPSVTLDDPRTLWSGTPTLVVVDGRVTFAPVLR